MSFRSLKIVPTISGCVEESNSEQDQIVFPSLEKLMVYGWKSAKFNISLNGSFRIDRLVPVFPSELNSTTYVDFGNEDANSPNGPFNMSDFVCEPRGFGQHIAEIQYTDSSSPDEIFKADAFFTTEYNFAYNNGNSYWFANNNFTFIEITTDSSIGVEEVGLLSIDGTEVSKLYYDGRYESDFSFTLLENFVCEITTIDENIAN
jgi:hypothetical protein